MHIQSGKLNGMTKIGHILYALLMYPKGLNPSVANPNLKIRGSAAKVFMYSVEGIPFLAISGVLHYIILFNPLFLVPPGVL